MLLHNVKGNEDAHLISACKWGMMGAMKCYNYI